MTVEDFMSKWSDTVMQMRAELCEVVEETTQHLSLSEEDQAELEKAITSVLIAPLKQPCGEKVEHPSYDYLPSWALERLQASRGYGR